MFSSDPHSAPPFWTGGPNPCGLHNFPAKKSKMSMKGPRTRVTQPMTTGSSVFAIKYKDGIVMAADTLGSYGSLARYVDLERVIKVNDSTIVACTGDYADFQWLREVIEQKQIDEEVSGFGGCETTKPSALYHWLTRFLYNRRSKFDPLWTTVVVGGIQDGAPFLGCVNYIGVAYQENAISTGLGQDIAVPIMRNLLEKKDPSEVSLEEAKEAIRTCVRTLFYRDCRSTSRFSMAVVNTEGAAVEKPTVIDSNWEIAKFNLGYE